MLAYLLPLDSEDVAATYARLATVPECGHAIWFEKPQELLAAAVEHLGAATAPV